MRLLALVAYASADQRNRDAIRTREGYSTLIAPRTERSGPRPSAQRSSQRTAKAGLWRSAAAPGAPDCPPKKLTQSTERGRANSHSNSWPEPSETQHQLRFLSSQNAAERRRAPVWAPRTAYPAPHPCLGRAESVLNHYHGQLGNGRKAAPANGHEIRLPRGRHGVGRLRRTPETPASQDGLVQRRTSWLSRISTTREPRVVRGFSCSVP